MMSRISSNIFFLLKRKAYIEDYEGRNKILHYFPFWCLLPWTNGYRKNIFLSHSRTCSIQPSSLMSFIYVSAWNIPTLYLPDKIPQLLKTSPGSCHCSLPSLIFYWAYAPNHNLEIVVAYGTYVQSSFKQLFLPTVHVKGTDLVSHRGPIQFLPSKLDQENSIEVSQW